MDKEEFKFPDEKKEDIKAEEIQVEVEGDADTEIEVIDDTPEEDRDRPPMKEPPSEVTEEELKQYSDNVKKRIQHFSKGYHEERRAKEAAIREREEAVRAAQVLAEENKKLQASLGKGQETLLEQAKLVVAKELEEAERSYKQAYESGDSDALVKAQKDLVAAAMKAEKVKNFRPPLQKRETPVQPEPQPVAAPVDPKISAWREQNPWFGSNKRMTAVALTIHQELVDRGVNTTSDEYLETLNAEMREVFPSAFPSDKPVAKKTPVVTPASRSVAPKKITLTRTQETLAKRLGLTKEQYARAVAEQMRNQNV